MGILLELLNEWEIQLLVLLSFAIQVLLFFTGSLRQRSTNGLLRGTIWMAYLGADLVAIYALGYLSRHADTSVEKGCSTLGVRHPLAFLWAPFLLIHLGGQDTLTAFSMQDNNLWLRHLLNLVVQVILAIYVLWKSSSWHDNVHLHVTSILLFTAGIIKYGERTMALMYGKLNNNRESVFKISKERISQLTRHDVYQGLVCFVLNTDKFTKLFFERRTVTFSEFDQHDYEEYAIGIQNLHSGLVAKLLDVQLSLMYNDMYTKGTLLRIRIGIVIQCISQVSTIAALVIFVVMSKKQAASRLHIRVDVGITYTLFVGSILLEICVVFTVLLASPWTWRWLEDRGYHRLAQMSWSLVWRQERRPMWSERIAQYGLLSYCGVYDEPITVSQRVMSMMRKMARSVGVGCKEMINEKLFCLSKLLDTRYEAVDNELMECVVDEVRSLESSQEIRRQWQHMWPFLKELEDELLVSFPSAIAALHMITKAYLRTSGAEALIASSASAAALAQVCQKLSNYMMYLVAVRPDEASVLQFGTTNNVRFLLSFMGTRSHSVDVSLGTLLEEIKDEWPEFPWNTDTEQPEEVLKVLRVIWVRLLIYAAGKSPAEAHAAQLAKGGDLLTFTWLFMAHCGFGDCMPTRVEPTAPLNDSKFKVIGVFSI